MTCSWPIAVVAVLMAMTTVACVTTHAPEDARELDTTLAPDAVLGLDVDAFQTPDSLELPDGFMCADGDGDGEIDARCGGTDCDDRDPAVSSTRTLCASPTSVTRCDGTTRVDAVCDGAAPYCDARTNGCVPDACGDLVVHANEQCDDGRDRVDFACVDCTRTCRSSDECEAGFVCRPFMSTDYERRLSGCAPANPGGAPFGARCATDSECYSGLCSPADARCTESAVEAEIGECSGPHRWSEHVPLARNAVGGGGFVASDSTCAFECQHDDECAAGATCVSMTLARGGAIYIVGGCRADWTRGTTPQGETCTFDRDCASGVCVYERCSRHCRDDADCDAAAPNCVAADRAMPPAEVAGDYWACNPRPLEWGPPFSTVCLP